MILSSSRFSRHLHHWKCLCVRAYVRWAHTLTDIESGSDLYRIFHSNFLEKLLQGFSVFWNNSDFFLFLWKIWKIKNNASSQSRVVTVYEPFRSEPRNEYGGALTHSLSLTITHTSSSRVSVSHFNHWRHFVSQRSHVTVNARDECFHASCNICIAWLSQLWCYSDLFDPFR